LSRLLAEASAHLDIQFKRLLADQGIVCSVSRAGNVWDNAAVESFYSSMKIERVSGKIYRTRGEARAHLFDYIARFYNPHRRHSMLGCESPIAFEAKMRLSKPRFRGTRGMPGTLLVRKSVYPMPPGFLPGSGVCLALLKG
jgi:putative transposase